MTQKLGRLGRPYPAPTDGNQAHQNAAPTAQANVSNDKYGWVALLVAVAALIAALAVLFKLDNLVDELRRMEGVVLEAASNASSSAVNAAVANERADKAERSAAIQREYAVQVFPQLNRMGYPVLSPGEPDHPVAQPEDYAKLDNYVQRRKEQVP